MVPITEITKDPGGRVVFIQLHHNEKTAVESALQAIELNGGKFITIENNEERNIDFVLDGRKFRFDPNRMFTKNGRMETLKSFKNYSLAAENELEKFSQFILQLVPPSAVVIAIHNNTDHLFSIDDYNKKRKGDADSVHINATMDPDDFIYTTDSSIYRQMVSGNINAVLQDNTNAYDDGSLSIHLGRSGRSYINVEAEHGHLEEQSRMISAVMKIFKD